MSEENREQEIEAAQAAEIEMEVSEVQDPAGLRADNRAALMSTAALVMFVGGALVTLMLVARAFNLHGMPLVAFVIASCTGVLGMAGTLLFRVMGDRPWIGAVVGGCFGALSAILVYCQTRHYPWWQ